MINLLTFLGNTCKLAEYNNTDHSVHFTIQHKAAKN